MMNRPSRLFAAALVLGLGPFGVAAAADEAADRKFVGTYSGQGTSLTVKADGSGGYVGELSKGDMMFPVTASADGDTLDGQFLHAEERFPFTVTRSGSEYTLKTGTTTLPLTFNPAAKPDDGGSDNPFNQPAAAPG